MALKWSDPIVLKAGGGLALYAVSSSRTVRLVGLALIGWAAWEYFKPAAPAAAPKVIPYDPDAPLPLQQGQTQTSSPPIPSADPFAGTRWQGTGYTPSIAYRPEGTTGDPTPNETGKVIPLRRPTAAERRMFYGINPDDGSGNVG